MVHAPIESRKSILIVDDEDEIRELLATLVYNEFGSDVRVVESPDGVDALCKINFQKFDCILTDIQMPKKDGKAFIKTVRQNTYNDTTPVVVISGTETNIIESQFPFVYFVAKPFDTKSLSELLSRLMQDGSTENKVSAGALNLVLQSVQDVIKNQLSVTDVTVGKPQLMNDNFSYTNKMTSQIKLSVGKVDNQVSYFVTKNSLQKLYKDATDLEQSNKLLAKRIAYELRRQKQLIHAAQVISLGWKDGIVPTTKKEGILIPVSYGETKIEVFAKVGQ